MAHCALGKVFWGKALFFGDRTSYYQIPPYFLCKILDTKEGETLLEVEPDRQVWKKNSEIYRIGRKIESFKTLYSALQSSLNALELCLKTLPSYETLVAIDALKSPEAALNPAVGKVVLAELPQSQVVRDWDTWEIDAVVRLAVRKHQNKLLELENGNYVYQHEALICTDDQWEVLSGKYRDVLFSQKNLVNFIESIATYQQAIELEKNGSPIDEHKKEEFDENTVYEMLVKYPHLSLREVGKLVGFKSSQPISAYYSKLKATLPPDKLKLILREKDKNTATQGTFSKSNKNSSVINLKQKCKSLEKRLDDIALENQQLNFANEKLLEKIQKGEQEIANLQAENTLLKERFSTLSEEYLLGNNESAVLENIKRIIQKYEDEGIAKGYTNAPVRACFDEILACLGEPVYAEV
ncbi:hypothetical protein FD723_39800 (plasmid) [Nostoc sp. C052]|uniref:hypothetical protein n=1 Tax=Nostoc sp. C052 TaxID=2576902 RepID=UPI0015C3C0F3|nr:hypothetical protein [Nostoc sp. C052]QLE46357.1 hypothetical protein FD723_39800 [Nostoc sp. C052]